MRDTLNESMSAVIDRELADLTNKANIDSVEHLNENFLKTNSNSYECVIEACKLIYDLDSAQNPNKALDLLMNLKSKGYSIKLDVKTNTTK